MLFYLHFVGRIQNKQYIMNRAGWFPVPCCYVADGEERHFYLVCVRFSVTRWRLFWLAHDICIYWPCEKKLFFIPCTPAPQWNGNHSKKKREIAFSSMARKCLCARHGTTRKAFMTHLNQENSHFPNAFNLLQSHSLPNKIIPMWISESVDHLRHRNGSSPAIQWCSSISSLTNVSTGTTNLLIKIIKIYNS